MSGPAASQDTDLHDARRAAAGDAAAFERLYLKHAGRIRTVSRRLLGPSQADDGVQEIFLRAWTKLPTFRGDSAFGTWLYRLGLNVLLRQLEKRRAADEIDGDPVEMVLQPPAGHSDVDRALQSLTPALREVVVLHDMQDHTHEDIAELLGITVSASKMRLQRARTALRHFMVSMNYD